MKIKYIQSKMVNGKSAILKDIAQMGPKNYEFFEQVLDNLQGELFAAGAYEEKISANLKIKHTTYWSRIKYLEEKAILKKFSRGIYKINTNWVSVFEVEINKK